ncbi:MAG TPA: hypothetical protein VE935_03370 [Burkholderiales bacterium]|jgi:hypothetical protein|nr:hypothetical protein [Burkholderiales bacterium]
MRRQSVMFDFRERRPFGRTKLVVVFVLGAAAGFAAGHWLRGEMTQVAAEEAAREARMELAAAVCADDFMDQSDASTALAKLAALHWDKRAEILVREGWATMPDRGRPDKAAARLCAAKLGEAYTSVRETIPVVPAAQ